VCVCVCIYIYIYPERWTKGPQSHQTVNCAPVGYAITVPATAIRNLRDWTVYFHTGVKTGAWKRVPAETTNCWRRIVACTSYQRTVILLEEWSLLGCYAVWPLLLVTASVFPSSPILVILMEALSSSKTSVLTRATRRNNPEDTILHISEYS
jgi:hypothetical protein